MKKKWIMGIIALIILILFIVFIYIRYEFYPHENAMRMKYYDGPDLEKIGGAMKPHDWERDCPFLCEDASYSVTIFNRIGDDIIKCSCEKTGEKFYFRLPQ